MLKLHILIMSMSVYDIISLCLTHLLAILSCKALQARLLLYENNLHYFSNSLKTALFLGKKFDCVIFLIPATPVGYSIKAISVYNLSV